MNFMRSATAVVSLLTGSALADASTQGSTPRSAATFLHSWYLAYNAGDAEGVAALSASDARLGSNTGRSAIEAHHAAAFAKNRHTCRGSYDEVRELGTLAVAWGHESCLERSRNSTKRQRTHERRLLVFGKKPGGEWLITRETFEPVEAPKTVRSS